MSRRFHSYLTFLAVVFALVAAPVFAATKRISDAKPSGIPVGKPVLQSPAGAHKSPGGVVTFYTSQAAFLAAHPNLTCPDEDYQDFSNVLLGCPGPANNGTSCPGGYDVGEITAGLEITCTTNCTPPGANNGLVIVPAGFDGNPTIIFGSNYFADETRVNLTNAPGDTALALEISCHFGSPQVTVNVFDPANNLIGSTTSPCANAGTFLGMDTGTPPPGSVAIGHITINDGTGASVESTDNLCFGEPVPVELQEFTIE